jgi:ComF family protein
VSYFSGYFNRILDFALPQICELCEATLVPARRVPLCAYCHAALPRQPTPVELFTTVAGSTINSITTPLIYTDCAAWLIAQLKFAHNARAAKILAAEIAAAVLKDMSPELRPQILVPVPLSWRSQFRRGYNQADWLSYYVGLQLNIPTDYKALSRTHRTSQRTLSKAQRLTLPNNTFKVAPSFQTKHVAIIDDVYTTGATTRALANQLRRAGVERIDVWSATRAVLA